MKQTDWNETMAVTVIESDSEYYLLLTSDNLISASVSVVEGVRYYENMYNDKHRQSYESSMSATLNHLFFQPSVLPAPPKEEVRQALADERAVQVSSVAGRFRGALLKHSIGKQWWDKGTKPRLISI